MSNPLSRSNTYSGGRQSSLRDKTSYGIMPTPPSPTETLPGLAQSASNSASNSSSSPPEPTTPPPRVNRSRTRYPDLGRVPLHRRGTSKTYERLEDLLKEAGYKETRIFTPETERVDTNADREDSTDNRLSVVKDGMDAVVGFFAGLLPNATASKTNLSSTLEPGSESTAQYTTSPQDYSPPSSPLTQRYPQKQSSGRRSFDMTEPPTPTTIMTSSIDSLGDPTPKANRQPVSRSNKAAPTLVHSNTHPPYHQPSLGARDPGHFPYHPMQKQSSRGSISRSSQAQPQALAQAPPYSPNPNLIASPRPSRAGAYLRHMASTSSMPARPNSTPVHLFNRSTMHLNDSDSEGSTLTYHRRGNGEGEGPDEPPLPPTWLETVARAVLFGGTGAYIGGPAQYTTPDPPLASAGSSSRVGKGQVLRPTRSSLSQVSRRSKYSQRPRSGLSDQTNTTGAAASSGGNTFLVPPPPLFSKIERGRAGRSEGQVSMTRVVCRSAPGSRSGSVVRGAGEDAKERWKAGKERGRGSRKRGEDKNRVPSLARTHVEGDVWSSSSRQQRHGHVHGPSGASSNHPNPNRHHLSGWGADVESEGSEGVDYEEEEEEEDEGELDLARILVPPKRQNSIKSLRKHLAADGAPASGAQATLKNLAGGIMPRSSRASRGMSVGAGGESGSGSGPRPGSAGPGATPRPRPGLLRRRRTEEDWDGESPEEWGGGWVRRSRGSRGSEDDDVESFSGFFGEGRVALQGQAGSKGGSGKSLLGFSSPWAGS